MNICIFCGSSPGHDPQYVEAARNLGRLLASRKIGLVHGGAKVGVMGALADAALDAGGNVIGIIPQSLVDFEVAHDGLTDLRIVSSMHERKALMADLSDAFIALPGGIGTLEETFEMLTWSQLGFHPKPVALLDIGGFFTKLTDFLDHVVAEGFLRPQHREILLCDNDAETLLAQIDAWEAPSGKSGSTATGRKTS